MIHAAAPSGKKVPREFSMSKIGKKERVLFIACVVLIALSNVVISFFYRYDDIISMTAWSVNFWDALFSGRILDYYTVTAENLRGAVHDVAGASYLTFFPWIIWNIVLYLTHPTTTRPNVTSGISIIWSRLFLYVCLAVLCYFVYRIIVEIKKDELKGLIGAVFVLGSVEVLESVSYAGQDEIVYLAAFVIALWARLTGRKKLSLIMGVISVTLCPIMLLPYLMMEAVYEKRPHFLALNALITLIPTLLFELVYHGNDAYQAAKGFNTTGLFSLMMGVGVIDVTTGSVQIGFVFLAILFFIAYARKTEESEKSRRVIYYLACTFFVFDFTTFQTFYRLLLYVPFFVLLIMTGEKDINLNSLLFALLGSTRIVLTLCYAHCMNNVYRVENNFPPGGLREFSILRNTDSLKNVCRAASIGIALALLYFNHRKVKEGKYSVDIPWKISVAAYCVLNLGFMIYASVFII